MAAKKLKEETVEQRIQNEIKTLNQIYSKIAKDTKATVNGLIENAAFMSVTLADLQKEIAKNGCVEEYQNGANQKGYKKSSAVEVYNTMIQRYTNIIKQLTDLLPDAKENNVNAAGEALARFVAQGKPQGGGS